jgi:mannitol/fructose-specific phosphotransferase system IIA component (Ntr-type)
MSPELTLLLDGVASRDDLFRQIGETVANHAPDLDAAAIVAALQAREAQSPTSTDEGVAFPHAVTPDIRDTCVLVARLRDGVDFGAPGHPPVDLVFCMLGNADRPWEHVKLLARLSRIVHTEQVRAALRAAASPSALLETVLAEDRRHG